MIFVISISLARTSFGFPYKDDSTGNPTPQRNHVFHTIRTFYDIDGNVRKTDSGYMFLGWDRNALKTIEGVVMAEGIPVPYAEMCDNEVLCGLPIIVSRMFMLG
jgi:hypothetical protein